MTFHFARVVAALAIFTGAAAVSCGSDDEEKNTGACSLEDANSCDDGLECQEVAGGGAECFCSPEAQTGCKDGQACEAVVGGNTACFAPITVQGRVFDLGTDEGIEGARVIARDANDVAASGVAVTDENGMYELVVPTPRDADGNPQSNQVTLRADAAGYLTFPKAPRIAIPFDTANAAGDPLVLETSATNVGLIALESSDGLGSISGTVLADRPAGTLVVAGGASGTGGGVTALADRDGSYTVFNVPPGSVSVRGYKVGLQLEPATAEVTAGQETEDVDLEALGEATAIVSGKIEIVDSMGAGNTSVILVVDETFDNDVARGEAPPGLRVGDVSGDFTIEGVPDGRYVVLAAFENDGLVRDPDTGIGGTDLVRVTIPDDAGQLSESFKVTGALAVTSPDGEQVVSATPTFIWQDDSSEGNYELYVFDAFGNEVWSDKQVPEVSGSKTVEVTYPGTPALEPGQLYQFRALSIGKDGIPISATEDLRGVFLVE